MSLRETKIGQAVTSPAWWDSMIRAGAKAFAGGFAAVWVTAGGASFDDLATAGPWQGGAVALVLAVLYGLGATQVGDPTEVSLRRSTPST